MGKIKENCPHRVDVFSFNFKTGEKKIIESKFFKTGPEWAKSQNDIFYSRKPDKIEGLQFKYIGDVYNARK